MLIAMDDVALGRRVRAVRLRLRWRQVDVARRAGLSQDTVSRVERGQLGGLTLRTLRGVLRALEMEFRGDVWWRGGDLDRLTDEGHAALVVRVVRILHEAGWVVRPETSFSEFGERGSIDILAYHEPTRLLLVVEVKTALTSLEETLRRHDVKVRLAPVLARRLGWAVGGATPLLVLPDVSTARRRVARVDDVLRQRYPLRGRAASRWLLIPSACPGLLLFVSPTDDRRASHPIAGRRRVRRAGDAARGRGSGVVDVSDAPRQ